MLANRARGQSSRKKTDDVVHGFLDAATPTHATFQTEGPHLRRAFLFTTKSCHFMTNDKPAVQREALK
jgi:hypothetical protein